MLLRRGIAQSKVSVPDGLQWLTEPAAPSARGISIPAISFNVTPAGVGVQFLEFDVWLEDSAFTSNISVMADTGSTSSIRHLTIEAADRIRVLGNLITFGGGADFFDGNFHTIKIAKYAHTGSAQFEAFFDGALRKTFGSSSTNQMNHLAATLNTAGTKGLKGILRNVKYVDHNGATTHDLPIDDGSGTVITNNGTGADGNIVNATVDVDYQWNT